VRFGSVNGRYEKCDGMDFILVSLHPGVNFRKKKKPKHFKILEGRPKVFLYIFPKKYMIIFILSETKSNYFMINNHFYCI
jgi:hypothetical protein